MIDRIEMVDRLASVTTTLTGISQLMMMTYEDLQQNGVDSERLLVLRDVIERCWEELDSLKRELKEE